MFSIMVPRVPVARSTADSSTSPFCAVCTRVALISWIDADVWSTLAASASALRARCCIWAAISTMVEEVSSVELLCISAPLAIWVELAEISSAEVATVREETAIWVAISRRFLTICRIECSSQPISSRERLRMSAVRSPLETCSASTPRAGQRIGDEPGQHQGEAEPRHDRDHQQHQDGAAGIGGDALRRLELARAELSEARQRIEGAPPEQAGQRQHRAEAGEDLPADRPVLDDLREAWHRLVLGVRPGEGVGLRYSASWSTLSRSRRITSRDCQRATPVR